VTDWETLVLACWTESLSTSYLIKATLPTAAAPPPEVIHRFHVKRENKRAVNSLISADKLEIEVFTKQKPNHEMMNWRQYLYQIRQRIEVFERNCPDAGERNGECLDVVFEVVNSQTLIG